MPVAELEAPRLEIDAAELQPAALPAPDSTSIAEVVAAEHKQGPLQLRRSGRATMSSSRCRRLDPLPLQRRQRLSLPSRPSRPSPRPGRLQCRRRQVQRTNGSGGKAAAAETIPPPHGAVPPGAEREPAFSDPQHPRPPDDPGIPDAEPAEAEPRRFRLF